MHEDDYDYELYTEKLVHVTKTAVAFTPATRDYELHRYASNYLTHHVPNIAQRGHTHPLVTLHDDKD